MILVELRAPGFGYIDIDNQRVESDVILCRDRIEKRRKDLSARYRSLYGHTPLSREELERYIAECRDFDVLVIATGYYGALPIPQNTRELLRSLDKPVYIEKTPQAVNIVNELLKNGKRVLALIHVTC